MMLSQTTTRVFVYGTLRKGEPNHHLLDDTMFVRRALTAPSFALYDLGHLEAHPRFYHRTTITLDDGEPVIKHIPRVF